MSDTDNVRNLHQGPKVPDFQHQPRQEQPSSDDSLIERVIARTVEEVSRRVSPPPSPFNLNTFDDVRNFAELLASSSMCPEGYKKNKRPEETIADIVIAVLKGKELRPQLAPLQSVQSIAVVNGRPALWGEAVPGLCMATGQVQDVKEWFEGDFANDGGEFTAICEVTRRGYSPRQGRFSRADAKLAGLGNVHRSYPKDMLMWRARHRAWHGVFPDVLSGLGTAEIEADLANQPVFVLPRPERAWATAPASSDGWDNAWLQAGVNRLMDTSENWDWLEALLALQKEAPTLRDIRELEDLQGVVATIKVAPEEVRERIAKGFRDANERLGKPPLAQETEQKTPPQDAQKPPQAAAATPTQTTGQTTAPPAGSTEAAADTFEYVVQDETGSPVDGEFHTDPVTWARAYAEVADPRTMAYMALREHNADALADAAKNPEAAKILAAIEAEADVRQDAPPPVAVIEPTIARGRADWPTYLADFETALALQDAKSVHGWVELQRERVSRVTQATRMAATKLVIDRCKALGVAPPAGFAQAPKAEPEPKTPPADSVVTNPAVDKDARLLETFTADVAACRNEHEVRHFSNQATVTTTLDRWTREGKTDLADGLRKVVGERITSLATAA